MNLEEVSFVNMIHFYREELQAIEDGGRPSQLFTSNERRRWMRKGVLVRWGNGVYALTPKAREVLGSIKEFLAESKEDWETR